MSGTLLYNENNVKIYPKTDSDSVFVEDKTLTETISDINSRIAVVDGSQTAVNNIIIKVEYIISNTSDINAIKSNTELVWGTSFLLPTASNPYAWKKTTISYKGQDNTNSTYEIVVADTAEISQTIYTATTSVTKPTISYPLIASDNINVDNTQSTVEEIVSESNKKDTSILWYTTPVSISAAYPYGYIATRVRKNGIWTKFVIALNSNWSYDSKFIIKYTTSNNTPEVDRKSENPGTNWLDNATGTGKLWMITATYSGKYLADSDGNYWSIPLLISTIQ